MSPEERDELMEFILQSQANAALRHQDAMSRMDEFDKQMKESTVQIQALAAVSRDHVEIVRRHSSRLDRLDDLNP
jgi:hypothetical protein